MSSPVNIALSNLSPQAANANSTTTSTSGRTTVNQSGQQSAPSSTPSSASRLPQPTSSHTASANTSPSTAPVTSTVITSGSSHNTCPQSSPLSSAIPSLPLSPPSQAPGGTNTKSTQPQTAQTSHQLSPYSRPKAEAVWKSFLTTGCKAAFAIVGLSCAIYFGVRGLQLQEWSAKNDSLQACLQMQIRSAYCNETIAAGVHAPPKTKRRAGLHSVTKWGLALGLDAKFTPTTVVAYVVLTIAAVIVTTIYFCPRMEPFHPIVSNARRWTATQVQLATWTVSEFWYGPGGTTVEEDSIQLGDELTEDPDEGSESDEHTASPNEIDLHNNEEGADRPYSTYSDEEVAVLVRKRLATLEQRHEVHATEPNKEKRILLRMMCASSFYTLFACFFEMFGPDIPDALLWKLEDASGEEFGPTEGDLRELRKFFQLPGPSVISLTSNAMDEFDVKVRDDGNGSTPGIRPQIALLAALIRLYDSPRGSDDIDENAKRDSTSEDRATITGGTHKQDGEVEEPKDDPNTIPLQSSSSHRSVNGKDRLPPESMRSYSPPPPSKSISRRFTLADVNRKMSKWRPNLNGMLSRKGGIHEASRPASDISRVGRAYQFGNSVIVEDEDGEIIKRYEIPAAMSRMAFERR